MAKRKNRPQPARELTVSKVHRELLPFEEYCQAKHAKDFEILKAFARRSNNKNLNTIPSLEEMDAIHRLAKDPELVRLGGQNFGMIVGFAERRFITS